MIFSKEEAIKAINNLSEEPKWASDDDWEWPNDLAIENAIKLIDLGLKANRLGPDANGGVALYHYGPGDKFAWFSTWNTGEIDSFYCPNYKNYGVGRKDSIHRLDLQLQPISGLEAEISFWNEWVNE